MQTGRFKKFVYDLPGIGKWIKQIQYERRMGRAVAVNVRLSEEEIIARLSAKYAQYIDRPPNIREPRAFSEKIQWRKLYDHDERLSALADKYAVREYVSRTIGDKYLIPLLGVWDRFDAIDFSILPQAFVLKATHATNTNLIVRDKSKMNRRLAKRKFDFWMKYPFPYLGNFEMHYLPIKPRIMAEQLLTEPGGGSLHDYKFLCFHGEPKYVWVDLDRYGSRRRNVYDLDWKRMPWVFHYETASWEVPKPEDLDEMIAVARALSSGFDHVRVDLYNIQGRIYFGEMTFTSGDGHLKITPDEIDFMLGAMW